MKECRLTTQSIADIKDQIDELESLLTERISELHEVKGYQESRHVFIFYRKLLWDIKRYLIDNIIEC